MNRLVGVAATAACTAYVALAVTAIEVRADERRSIQTVAGVIVGDYRAGNIPPADAISVRPGQTWQGRLELDDDGDMKFYVHNPRAAVDDPLWRQYWARQVHGCGDPGDRYARVTVSVDNAGRAIIRCH